MPHNSRKPSESFVYETSAADLASYREKHTRLLESGRRNHRSELSDLLSSLLLWVRIMECPEIGILLFHSADLKSERRTECFSAYNEHAQYQRSLMIVLKARNNTCFKWFDGALRHLLGMAV